MADKKVRIDEDILKRIKEFRKKRNNEIKYPSDKYLVQIAILNLLKMEEK